jgi:hypothetical protein
MRNKAHKTKEVINMSRFEKKENPMVARIPILCTPEQKEQIQTNADNAGISMSEFLRRRGLGETIQSKSDLVAMGQLNKLGGLLKHSFNVNKGANPDETRAVLLQINTLLKKLIEE